jgi:hypothetical protein
MEYEFEIEREMIFEEFDPLNINNDNIVTKIVVTNPIQN